MYRIFTYIYHIDLSQHVGKYSSPMEALGVAKTLGSQLVNDLYVFDLKDYHGLTVCFWQDTKL